MKARTMTLEIEGLRVEVSDDNEDRISLESWDSANDMWSTIATGDDVEGVLRELLQFTETHRPTPQPRKG